MVASVEGIPRFEPVPDPNRAGGVGLSGAASAVPAKAVPGTAGSGTAAAGTTAAGTAAAGPSEPRKPGLPGDTVTLSPEAAAQVAKLKARDAEVRAHEAAHLAAGGGVTRGGASFSYQHGPDGRSYANGGEVSVDTSPVANNPQATLAKANIIRAAALAPASPSPQDQSVAAAAAVMAADAAAEIAKGANGATQAVEGKSSPAQAVGGKPGQAQAKPGGPVAKASGSARIGGLLDVTA